MNAVKQARKDAEEAARAHVAYGEGAGTRRKLSKATIAGHEAKYGEAYSQAFLESYLNQDWDKLANQSKRDRRLKDASAKTSKTIKYVATGQHENLTAGVFAIVIIGTAVHQTGLDKLALEKAKSFKNHIKYKIYVRKQRKHILHLVKDA